MSISTPNNTMSTSEWSTQVQEATQQLDLVQLRKLMPLAPWHDKPQQTILASMCGQMVKHFLTSPDASEEVANQLGSILDLVVRDEGGEILDKRLRVVRDHVANSILSNYQPAAVEWLRQTGAGIQRDCVYLLIRRSFLDLDGFDTMEGKRWNTSNEKNRTTLDTHMLACAFFRGDSLQEIERLRQVYQLEKPEQIAEGIVRFLNTNGESGAPQNIKPDIHAMRWLFQTINRSHILEQAREQTLPDSMIQARIVPFIERMEAEALQCDLDAKTPLAMSAKRTGPRL